MTKGYCDISGKQFGRLTAIERVRDEKDGVFKWLCECNCENKTRKLVAYGNLMGTTKSCGCLKKELLSKRGKTHGMSETRIYRIWQAMKRRCYNPNDKRYDIYGGRGIEVCEDWKNNFESFCEWSMNNGYKENLTIDRIDNDKGYEPINCRWATAKEQANNKSNLTQIEINGEIKTMKEWSEISGVNYHTISSRINQLGYKGEEIIKPV